MTDYCTLSDIEKYANIDITDDNNPAILEWISDASAAIDDFCRHDFAQHSDVVEKYDGEGEWGDQDHQRHNVLFLKNRPVLSVSEVQNNGTVLTVTDDYVVYEDQAMIRLVPESNYFTKIRQGVQVTYTYGYAAVPQTIKNICRRLVIEALKEQMRFSEAGGADRVSVAGMSVSYPSFDPLPEWAQRALREYVQWGFS